MANKYEKLVMRNWGINPGHLPPFRTPPQPQQSSNPETQAPGHRIAPTSRILSFVLLTNEHEIYIIQKQMNTNNWEYRRSVIISAVEVQGTVSVAELAERLGVTETTIRRDLTELEHEGVVKRVHGGVVSACLI